MNMRPNQAKACSGCSLAKTASILGDLWTILIIRDLLEKPRRFNDLVLSLKGVSTRTLTKKLKELEEWNLITRETFKESPPRVMYSLTKKGEELSSITEAMKRFGEKDL